MSDKPGAESFSSESLDSALFEAQPAPGLPEAESSAKPSSTIKAAVPLSLVIAALTLFLFAWIAEKVFHEKVLQFDLSVRAWVHQFASPTMTVVMKAFSFIGETVLVAALIVALIVFLKLHWRRAAWWLTITMAGALVLDLALKFGFHRARPTPFFGTMPHTYSFPSGHSLFSFCFYGVMAGLLATRIQSLPLRILLWTSAAVLIGCIGLSRIYLGVHYPSDVLAGYLAAAVWVSSMLAVDRMRNNGKAK